MCKWNLDHKTAQLNTLARPAFGMHADVSMVVGFAARLHFALIFTQSWFPVLPIWELFMEKINIYVYYNYFSKTEVCPYTRTRPNEIYIQIQYRYHDYCERKYHGFMIFTIINTILSTINTHIHTHIYMISLQMNITV